VLLWKKKITFEHLSRQQIISTHQPNQCSIILRTQSAWIAATSFSVKYFFCNYLYNFRIIFVVSFMSQFLRYPIAAHTHTKTCFQPTVWLNKDASRVYHWTTLAVCLRYSALVPQAFVSGWRMTVIQAINCIRNSRRLIPRQTKSHISLAKLPSTGST